MAGYDAQLLVYDRRLVTGLEKLMSIDRRFVIKRFGIAVAIFVFATATTAFAQEAEDEADVAEDVSEEIEEITVSGRRPGDRRRVDEEYEDPVKAQLLKDFYQMKEDMKESAWRETAAEDSSRISWGYDPADEYHMRNEMALQDLPSERTKPASIFKVNF
jgi:hypothetical protein